MNLKVNYLATKRKGSQDKTTVDCGNIVTGLRTVQSGSDAIKLGEGSVSGVYVQNSFDNVDGDTSFIIFVCDKAHRAGIQLMPGEITPMIATDDLHNIWIFGIAEGSITVAFKGARIVLDTSQSIPDGVSTPLTFGSISYDTGPFIGGSTFVPDADGFYEIGVTAQFEANDVGMRRVDILVDAVSQSIDVRNATVGASNDTVALAYALLNLTSGQVVTFKVTQDSGGALGITNGQAWINYRGAA